MILYKSLAWQKHTLINPPEHVMLIINYCYPGLWEGILLRTELVHWYCFRFSKSLVVYTIIYETPLCWGGKVGYPHNGTTGARMYCPGLCQCSGLAVQSHTQISNLKCGEYLASGCRYINQEDRESGSSKTTALTLKSESCMSS